MKTNFFENIASMNTPGKWAITIHTNEQGQFTVSTLFVGIASGDKAGSAIPPLLAKGTAQELDEGYFDAIENPIQQTAAFYTSAETYLKGLEKARLASKMEQDKKNKNTPKPKVSTEESEKDDIEIGEPQPSKEDKRKAYLQAMIKINELNASCKYEEALALLPSVTDYPEKEAELKTKLADLTRKRDQMAQALTLFNES
jgi:PRTRC genetic system protein E